MLETQQVQSDEVQMKSPVGERTWLWLIPLLLVMFWLGARGLNADAIWFDEYWSIFNSGGVPFGPLSPAGVWERVAAFDPQQGPAYFIILNIWSDFVGSTPFAGRALSLLLGILAIGWMYRLGRDIFSARVGLYAAAVLTVSAFFVHYLHELRLYTLLALVTCITLWSYWRIITRRKVGLVPQLALAASVAFSLYLHYLTALTLIALGLYHLLFVPRDRRWWRVVGLVVVGGLLFFPWVSTAISSLDEKDRGADDPDAAVIPNLIYAFSNGQVILLAAFAVLAARWRGRGAGFVWFATLVLLALGLILNVPFKFHRVRYLMAAWPLLALVVALGVAWLAHTRIKPVLALGLWMVIGWWTVASPDFLNHLVSRVTYPFDVASDELRQHLQPGDVVAFVMREGDKTALRYELAHYYMQGLDIRLTLIGVGSWYDQALQFLQDSPLRLWLAYEQPTTLMTEFQGAIPAPYQQCAPVPTQATVQLDLYTRSPVCCLPDDAPARMRFGDGITLTGVDTLPDAASDTLPVLVGWSLAADVQPYTYSVALHVVDENDQLVAQSDYGLPNLAFSCQETSIDLSGLLPGRYSVYVIVYEWESGQRLQGEDLETGDIGERLALGTIEVE
jgi:hypothetical protein